MTELMTNGPLTVGLSVYDNFMYYDGTYIYNTTSDTPLDGLHAIKLIGWKTDATLGLTWIAQNQWGTSWGDSGILYI
jgi:C1A family cysteine protease